MRGACFSFRYYTWSRFFQWFLSLNRCNLGGSSRVRMMCWRGLYLSAQLIVVAAFCSEPRKRKPPRVRFFATRFANRLTQAKAATSVFCMLWRYIAWLNVHLGGNYCDTCSLECPSWWYLLWWYIFAWMSILVVSVVINVRLYLLRSYVSAAMFIDGIYCDTCSLECPSWCRLVW